MAKENKSLFEKIKDFNTENQNQMENITKGGVFGLYIGKIKAIYKKAPRLFLGALIGLFIALYLLLGSIECVMEGYHEFGIVNVIIEGFDGLSIPVVLLAEFGLVWLWYFFYSRSHSGQIYDEKRNLTISEEGTYGTAQQMTRQEKAEAFDSGDFRTNKNAILGADPQTGELYSVKEGYGINGNVLVVGSPGTGKTRCDINPFMFNAIRRGESVIVADPKLEIYGKTSEMAKAHGHVVKVFNTNPNLLLHSDGIDFMGVIGDNEFKIDAFVDTVMANISGTVKKEFWDKSQMNELKFLTTFVATNNVGIPKTLGGVYQFMNEHTVDQLEEIFMALPEDHPAKPAFNTWAGGDKVVKGNTHGGLQIDLQKLSNKLIQKITGTNEIDLTLPGKQPCIYYIAMSDQETSMQWLTALYWTFQIKELVEFADRQPARRCPMKVTLVLEEFYNIGLIPNWDNKLSQIRSRGLDSRMYIQSLGQLQRMYPDNLWEGIIDCCSTWILLGTRSLLTAEYFSKYCGVQTVITTSYRYEKRKGTENADAYVMTSTSSASRPLYFPDEIIRKHKDHILVSTSTFNVCELEKVDYSKHPMCKEIREVIGAEHMPEWVKHLSEYEKKLFKVDQEVYSEEGIWHIELCTNEDFKEPWNKKKEAALQEKIKEERQRMGMKSVSLDHMALSEDLETDNGPIERDLSLTDEEMGTFKNKSAAVRNENTGVYQKSRTVYNTVYETETGTIVYENEDHLVTPEEHMARETNNEYEKAIDDSKIGNLFKNM